MMTKSLVVTYAKKMVVQHFCKKKCVKQLLPDVSDAKLLKLC